MVPVTELAARVGAELRGRSTVAINGVRSLETAGPTDLSVLASARYLDLLPRSRAGAVLVRSDLVHRLPNDERAYLVVSDVHRALAEVLDWIVPPPPSPSPGVHPTAVLGRGVDIDGTAYVGPYVVIGDETRVGPRTRIHAHAVIGSRCRLGADCVVEPHATIHDDVVLGDRVIVQSGARIGMEGFGYAATDSGVRRLRHVGGCVLEDDVEIGCNATVARGSLGETRIGRGTKIDNLVHIAHNVRIGARCFLAAQVGVAGSTTIEDDVIIGGQAGIAGHVVIGAGARVGAQAGVTNSVSPGVAVSGYPARPHHEALRAQAALFRLPELVRRWRRTLGSLTDG
jgi:UDP-3-O-[3-hydroxymyristoyl] glucosamine N-acyltransferase